jgi:hypothetical protein
LEENLKPKIFLCFVLLLIAITFQPPIISAQDFPRVCLEDPANLMPNCKFDKGLEGWQSFTEDGTAIVSYLQGGGECHAPQCPAAYIVTESYFVGGIYQQVPAVAGNTYYANINWFVFDSFANDAAVNSVVGGIGRRVGIDPFGGADSRSSNVIWGPDNWRTDCKTCQVEYATATAQSDTITVFVRIDDTWRQRAAEEGYTVPPSKDQFWLDEVGLKQIGEGEMTVAANPTDPPPTDTPLPPPPTATPLPVSADTPVPATDTPVLPTETPAEVAQGESTPSVQSVSPIETPTTAVIAPPTLTPTYTPLPTNTPSARLTPTRPSQRHPTPVPAASSVLPARWLGVAGTTICGGGVIILIMVGVLAGLVWLYRLGWGDVDDDEPDEEADDEEIIVEIVE